MKRRLNQFSHFILSLALVMTSSSLPINAFAQTAPDPIVEQQKADCVANPAFEWSTTLNKCIQKQASQDTRNQADTCNKLTDMAQREACHKALAEKQTGLSSNTDGLNQGRTSDSLTLNSITTAYAMIGLFNSKGTSMLSSTCTSKKIFAYTALGGVLTDLYLKHQAKKKVEELKNKFKLDAKSGASASQSKALEYLREEQQTVADIAGQEKNRNMLLTLGYGAASVMAIIEMATYGTGNADCVAKNDTKTASNNETPAQPTSTEAAPAATTPPATATTPPATATAATPPTDVGSTPP